MGTGEKILIGLIIVAFIIVIILFATGVIGSGSGSGSGSIKVYIPPAISNIIGTNTQYLTNEKLTNNLILTTSAVTTDTTFPLESPVVWFFGPNTSVLNSFLIQSAAPCSGTNPTIFNGNYISFNTTTLMLELVDKSDNPTSWYVTSTDGTNFSISTTTVNTTAGYNIYITSDGTVSVQLNSVASATWILTDPTIDTTVSPPVSNDPTKIICVDDSGVPYIWALDDNGKLFRNTYPDTVNNNWERLPADKSIIYLNLAVKNTTGGNNKLWLIQENSDGSGSSIKAGSLYMCPLPANNPNKDKILIDNTKFFLQLDVSDSDTIYAIVISGESPNYSHDLITLPQSGIKPTTDSNGNTTVPWSDPIIKGARYVNVSKFPAISTGVKNVSWISATGADSPSVDVPGSIWTFPIDSKNPLGSSVRYNQPPIIIFSEGNQPIYVYFNFLSVCDMGTTINVYANSADPSGNLGGEQLYKLFDPYGPDKDDSPEFRNVAVREGNSQTLTKKTTSLIISNYQVANNQFLLDDTTEKGESFHDTWITESTTTNFIANNNLPIAFNPNYFLKITF